MIYNEEEKWFEEEKDEITYIIEDYNEEESLNEINKIEKWLKNELEETVKKAIVEKLLYIKNKEWLAKNEKEFSIDKIAKNLILSEVAVNNTQIELYFKENGIFDNNPILIKLDKIGDEYMYYGVSIE